MSVIVVRASGQHETLAVDAAPSFFECAPEALSTYIFAIIGLESIYNSKIFI